MATTLRASNSNSSTTGTEVSVVAPTGTTAGDVVIVSVHANGQTTIVDNNTTLSCINLTNGQDTTDDSDSTTASITPSANKLILLTVSSRKDTETAEQPTVTGCNLTWVAINTRVYDASGSTRRVTLFRAMGSSPTTGALTISFGATQTAKSWVVDEITNADTSGTNGSGAIVQSVVNSAASATSLTVTLAAFSSANNATYGGFGNAGEGALVAGTGFTRLATQQVAGEVGVATEFKSSNDTGVDMTGPTMDVGGIAIEIKSAAATFTEDINDYKPNTTGGHTVSIFSRRVVSGDPLHYNFTIGASGRWSIIADTWQNPNVSSIYDVSPNTANAANADDSSATTINAPSITTLSANAIHVVHGYFDDGTGGNPSGPAGYTSAGADNDEPQGAFYKVIAAAGATGAQTVTGTTVCPRIALSYAIKDIGGVSLDSWYVRQNQPIFERTKVVAY